MEQTKKTSHASSLLFLNVIICLSMTACGADNDVSKKSPPPSASSAKDGSITFRVANSRYDGNGNCVVSVAELNNSGHDIRTFQISKYEAITASGKTSKHSYLYDGMKNGESRQSNFYIAAPSCNTLTIDIVSVLCRSMDDRNEICDNEIEFVLEGNSDVQLTGSFRP